MPFKFLPAPDDWEKALAAVKVKPDSALSKALDESWKTDTDQPAKRMALLPKIQKLAMDFKKSKPVVAGGPGAAKLVQDLIDVIPVVRKNCEQLIKDFQRKEACEIDVQFIIQDWNGKSFEYAKGYVTFEAPGLPKINKIAALSASGLSFDAVRLRPKGTVTLSVVTGSQSIEGTTGYDFKPGQKLMQFRAAQLVKKQKTKAKTISEVAKKFGLKGSVGVDFKVVSVGGEASKESEYKDGYEHEVEWEVELGFPTFPDESFKQLK